MPQSRQLAAIMFTDIVGYTALMSDNEQKTFEFLRRSNCSNFRHLANVNQRNKIRSINERAGYFYPLDLVTPIQLMYYEKRIMK